MVRRIFCCINTLEFFIILGIGVCGSSPSVVLKEVAKQISDKDKSVRNAALNCMVEAYNILGDKVYKMIGNVCLCVFCYFL